MLCCRPRVRGETPTSTVDERTRLPYPALEAYDVGAAPQARVVPLRSVARVAGELTAREMLLEAAVLEAAEMKSRGFLHRVLAADALHAHALERAARIASLAPGAARLNKQTFRALKTAPALEGQAQAAIENIVSTAYDYADSAEHREGIDAFLAKRPARF